VSAEVRDRLAGLAAEQGTTIRALVEQLAARAPTQQELRHRTADAAAYVAAHVRPGFGDEDAAAGERLWQALQADDSPTAASGGTGGQAA
jgi:hypothetical protein